MGVWHLSGVRLQYGSMASVRCETPVWEYGSMEREWVLSGSWLVHWNSRC